MGRLKFPKKYANKVIRMDDGLEFRIFRHMKLETKQKSDNEAIFIVRFKFKKLSHKGNIRSSRIPIPLIAGFSGFKDKIWMIDWKTGYWQGIYQWENEAAIERYKKSFVLGIMNKRSIPETLSYKTVCNINLEDYIESLKNKKICEKLY